MLDHPAAKPPSRHGRAPAPDVPVTEMPDSNRVLLARVVRGVAGVLEPVLVNTLDQLEKSLFAQADTGACELQQAAFDAMRQVRRYRADLLPAFLSTVQARVDAASSGTAIEATRTAEPASAWSLLDNAVVEESALIDALGARAEARAHLALHLLVHRFAVLLQREEIEARSLPIGPHALLRALRDASTCLDLATPARHALLRQFDRCLAPLLADMYARANACLADAGILPDLDGYRTAPRAAVGPDSVASVAGDSTRTAAEPSVASSDTVAAPARSDPSHRDTSATNGRHVPESVGAEAMHWQKTNAADDQLFTVMRDLLGSRRALLGRFATGAGAAPQKPAHAVSPVDVDAVLRTLQRTAPTPDRGEAACEVGSRAARRGLKSQLLSQLQASAPVEHCVRLPETHSDVVDLCDLLFDHLLKDVPTRRVAVPLLTRLQVPLLRVALGDTGFFTQQRHPARRLLDALAEAGLYWYDDADVDDEFGETLRKVVERVATDFDGDLAVFEIASEQLQQQLDTRMRKAAIAERRHIEAERGRERLERARAAAADAVRNAIGDRPLSSVVHHLLTRAWTDVLALTLLRGNDGERQFARQMMVVEWLVRHHEYGSPGSGECSASSGETGGLRQELSSGLCQIGYHLDDAESLARTVFGALPCVASVTSDATDADKVPLHGDSRNQVLPLPSAQMATAEKAGTGSSGETCGAEQILALHGRLGAACEQPGTTDEPHQVRTADPRLALDAATRQRLEQLHRLPFGTWFDLTDKGRRLRCRMSWFSPVTGRCLFVNHRGQRVGDHTLTWLAVEMEQGRARSVREAQTSVVDSAWQAILGMLRSFAPKVPDPAVA